MKHFLLIFFVFSSLLFSQEHFILNIEETGESTLFIFQNDIASLNDGDELGIFDANGIVDSDGNFGELIGFALATDTNDSTKLVEVALRLINNS